MGEHRVKGLGFRVYGYDTRDICGDMGIRD